MPAHTSVEADLGRQAGTCLGPMQLSDPGPLQRSLPLLWGQSHSFGKGLYSVSEPKASGKKSPSLRKLPDWWGWRLVTAEG